MYLQFSIIKQCLALPKEPESVEKWAKIGEYNN
jgi:hypothetical protein